MNGNHLFGPLCMCIWVRVCVWINGCRYLYKYGLWGDIKAMKINTFGVVLNGIKSNWKDTRSHGWTDVQARNALHWVSSHLVIKMPFTRVFSSLIYMCIHVTFWHTIHNLTFRINSHTIDCVLSPPRPPPLSFSLVLSFAVRCDAFRWSIFHDGTTEMKLVFWGFFPT